jgi:hypothetical protein
MSDATGARALHTAFAPAVTRRSLLVAAIIGRLHAIDQGDNVLTGEQPQWLKVALTYAVPSFVSSCGACAASGQGQRLRPLLAVA